MKTTVIIIILTLIGMTSTILYTVMQPIEPICEKQGSPIPCDSAEDRRVSK